jgi:outer membrane receptor protein involved in Fe transport
LRNLGTDRTLVLVDGRRHVSSVEGSASVDINTIPEDLIERVDVLTGGASAIYGADGVSGVVNFVLKKNFEGLTGRVQAGISKYGDAGQRYATLTAGHNFGDGRGNVALSYEFGDEDRLDVHRRINSNFTSLSYNPDYDRSVPGSYYRMPQKDVRYAWTSRKGAVDVDGDGIPDYLGTGAVYNQGRDLLYGNFTQGGDDTRTTDYMNDLRPATTRHVVNFIGHYDFSPVFQVFGEAKYVNTMSYSLAQPTFDYSMFVPGDNPYMPTSIRNAIDPGMGGVLVTRDNFDLGQRGERIKRETFRAVVGVRGDFGAGFHYEVSYNHGQTTITNHFVNDRYTDRWNAAIDAVTDPSTGKPTCRVNLDPTAADAITFTPGQCVPFNVFGEGQSSQAALAWLRADTTEHSRITQDVVSGQLSGDTHSFFTLPGGPIGFAVGAEYRKETSRFTPDPLEQQGLTFSNKLLPSHGSYDVKEVFGEVDLPFIKDRPFIHLLDVSAAIRYSNYSTIGSTTAWKVDATWAPVRDIRFRGTYSTAVRAPNIGELFGAASQTYAFFDDPCSAANRTLGKASRAANCTTLLQQAGLSADAIANFAGNGNTSISGISGGNAALAPERAKTWTAGVVLSPSFLRGFQASVDWYSITINQAINTVQPQQMAELCVDQPSLDNAFCSAISRASGTGYINGFVVGPQNVANFKTAGLDLNLSYTLSLDHVGTFAVRLIGSYLDKLTFVGTPGAEATDELGQTYAPRWQAYGSVAYSSGPVTLAYNVSWYDKTMRFAKDRYQSATYVAPEYAWFKERWVHNIQASFAVTKVFEFYGGVTNLFDQKPDLGSITYPTEYVGRSFYAGARFKF